MDNERRAKKFQEELEKAEAAEKAHKTKAARFFDPAVCLADAKRIHVVHDDALGEVRYGVLTKREVDQITAEEPDGEKRAYKMIFAMLKKGYPDSDMKLTDIEDWPYWMVARTSEVLSRRFTYFLQPTPKQSPNG